MKEKQTINILSSIFYKLNARAHVTIPWLHFWIHRYNSLILSWSALWKLLITVCGEEPRVTNKYNMISTASRFIASLQLPGDISSAGWKNINLTFPIKMENIKHWSHHLKSCFWFTECLHNSRSENTPNITKYASKYCILFTTFRVVLD